MNEVRIERVGDRIHARIPWNDGRGPEFAKKIIGARWSKSAKVWTYPLDMYVCREMRSVFGNALRVGPKLTLWAHEAVAREKAVEQLHAFDPSTPVDLPRVRTECPEMWNAMLQRSFQTIAAAFAVTAGPHLLADQPGLGKTVETFAGLIESDVSGLVLVIAPQSSLYATWANEVDKWLAGSLRARAFVAGDGDMTAARRQDIITEALAWEAAVRQEPGPRHLAFIIINAEMVRLKEVHRCPSDQCDGQFEYCSDAARHESYREAKYPSLFDITWDAIIGDEVHRYLLNANPRSKKVTQVGLGFQRLRLADNGFKAALSGTPMRGKPRLLWPVFRWLRPDIYTSQWQWSRRYFQTTVNDWTGNDQVTDDLRPDAEEAFNREVSKLMLRRTKAELRAINPEWAPPDKRYMEVWLPLGKQQSKVYWAMAKHATTRLQNGTLTANGILAEMTRLRQFASCSGDIGADGAFVPALPSNKFDWLVGFLAEHGITGDPTTEQGGSKIVVASQFTSFINLWAAELQRKGIAVHVLTGDTSNAVRRELQADWQTPGGPRVLLLNTNAGGVSLTLDFADDLVIMDETWVPDDQEQVEDRVHRTSRTDHQVTIWYVRSEDTIERDIAGSNILKDDRQKRVLDGRRGIETAKRLWNVEVGQA